MLGTNIAKVVHLVLGIIFLILCTVVAIIATYMITQRPDDANPILYTVSAICTGYSTLHHFCEYAALLRYTQTADIAINKRESIT